jgi:hypothetical protein
MAEDLRNLVWQATTLHSEDFPNGKEYAKDLEFALEKLFTGILDRLDAIDGQSGTDAIKDALERDRARLVRLIQEDDGVRKAIRNAAQ